MSSYSLDFSYCYRLKFCLFRNLTCVLLVNNVVKEYSNLQYLFLIYISSNILSMFDVNKASLVFNIVLSIIAIIDTINQVYKIVKNKSSLLTNFKKLVIKLFIISKLLNNTKKHFKATSKLIKIAFIFILENCKI